MISVAAICVYVKLIFHHVNVVVATLYCKVISEVHIIVAQFGRQFLNGVAKTCASHLPDVVVEEIQQQLFVALTHFAQHQSNGLVKERFLVAKQ